jgi:hypothetical protein
MSDELTVGQLIERVIAGKPLPKAHLLVETQIEPTNPAQEQALASSTLVGSKKKPLESLLMPNRTDTRVYAVEKSTRNPFSDMVTIGRALNNDIIIGDVGISKFHGYVRITGNEVRFHDAGSTNGSRVDGRPVGREGACLTTMARIELGPARQLVFVARDEIGSWLDTMSGMKLTPPTKPAPPTERNSPTTRFGPRPTDPDPTPPSLQGSPLSTRMDPSALATQREVGGSLSRESIDVLLARLAAEKWSGRVEASVPSGPRIEIGLSSGSVGGFVCNSGPGTPRDLARVMASATGMYLLRKGARTRDLDGTGWTGPVDALLQQAREARG